MKIKKKELKWALERVGLDLHTNDTYPRGNVGVLLNFNQEPIGFVVGTKRRRKV